jgi:hypothetical protein
VACALRRQDGLVFTIAQPDLAMWNPAMLHRRTAFRRVRVVHHDVANALQDIDFKRFEI